jgi:hypothetical protein
MITNVPVDFIKAAPLMVRANEYDYNVYVMKCVGNKAGDGADTGDGAGTNDNPDQVRAFREAKVHKPAPAEADKKQPKPNKRGVRGRNRQPVAAPVAAPRLVPVAMAPVAVHLPMNAPMVVPAPNQPHNQPHNQQPPLLFWDIVKSLNWHNYSDGAISADSVGRVFRNLTPASLDNFQIGYANSYRNLDRILTADGMFDRNITAVRSTVISHVIALGENQYNVLSTDLDLLQFLVEVGECQSLNDKIPQVYRM